jgi:hypothetical protein
MTIGDVFQAALGNCQLGQHLADSVVECFRVDWDDGGYTGHSLLKLQAITGGLALLIAIGFWYRPFDDKRAGRRGEVSACRVAATHDFCDAVAGLSTALRNPFLRVDQTGILPPRDTPGAVDPSITQANIGTTICRPGYARSVRPAFAVTAPVKRRLMDAQHPGESFADYELDHLIPISLGGAPLDLRDLWLQPRRGQANAADKNALAYVLWQLVCERRVPLRTAQQAIRRDWTKAYDTYATPENVARYHFAHRQEERD